MGTAPTRPRRYQCDTCKRSTLVDTNPYGIDILRKCSLTSQCRGSLFPVIVDTTNIDPTDDNVTDSNGWSPRQVFKQHIQTVKSQRWTVNHQISSQPTVFVYESLTDGSSVKWVRVTDFTHEIVADGVSVITFKEPKAGSAHFTSLSSRAVAQPTTTAATLTQSVSTLTGEVTVATLSSDDRIGLTLTFFDTGASTSTPVEYISIPIGPSSSSAWFGSSEASINGRKYYLRSFNLITSPLAQGYFTSGLIVDGNGVYISSLNGREPQRGECLVLLSNAPHQVADRVTTSVIDASQLSSTSQYAFVSGKTLYVDRSMVKTTYPPVTAV